MISHPHVSIVMPVRDEADNLRATLDACLEQRYEGPLEIIVAYAESDDATRDILAVYERSSGIRVVDNPQGTTPAGLNAAIDAARGDIIVRCDGHAVLPADYVETAAATLAETGAGNVGGVQRAVGSAPMQRAIARAMTNPIGVGDARFHRGGPPGPTDTVYLGVFRREALDDVGGYDESLVRNQDYELNVRLREAGWTVWFDPALEVVYTPRGTLSGLWSQYRQYGSWKRKVIALHPGSIKARQLGPPLLVAGLAVGLVSLPTRMRPLGMTALGGYAGVLAGVGLYEAWRTRDPATLLTGAAVGVMHVSWGTGFLTGRT
ncbi:MAG: glycosyltransferase family 2 protein [Acidimicrobiia bacterium]|nr:glycosyltransferase family 2 protein [Acidimicrobiia bacterium]